MPKFHVPECSYYSQADEAAFFAWLQSIPGVRSVVGTPTGLEVTLQSSRLSQIALRELLALHFRYGLPMSELARFETAQNKPWFRASHMYWYERVFGK